MLRSIKIVKLFGRFTYKLEFTDSGIIIITGPNGYGKSTILRILYDFCNNSFGKVLSYTFDKLEIESDSGTVKIKKSEKTFSINNNVFPYPNESWESSKEYPYYIRRYSADSLIDIRTHQIVRFPANSEKFLDVLSDENGNDKFWGNVIGDMIFKSFSKENKKSTVDFAIIKSIVDQLQQTKNDIGQVHFIQEQRLIEKRIDSSDDDRHVRMRKEKYVSVINENSEKLKTNLEDIMKTHSALSNELDSSYIKRLFNTPDNETTIDISSRIKELQSKQEKLQKYGLAEIQNASYLTTLDEEKIRRFSTELSIYLEDANAKYAVFEKIINKLELYEKIVNEKITFKKMALTRANGITIITDEGEKLELADLSSGEQEILVLFYKLIFESDVDLLLIDEPEISLHIAWQKELMDDLKSIVLLKDKKIKVIVATHSPQIISHNWDLQIDLGGLHNG